MWERLRRFSALERPAQALFVRSSLTLVVVSLSLRWRGFRATQAMLQRRIPSNQMRAATTSGATALTVRMVKAAVRHNFINRTCLEESLTLWWLLARQRIRTELRIGVQKQGSKFAAHAWVESEGVALNEPEAQHRHFAAFESEIAAADAVMR